MWWLTLEAYLESNATSTVELFSKTVNSFKLFDLLLNVRLSFRYAYEYYNNFFSWRFHFNPLATGGGEGPLDRVLYVSAVFSHLLNFCREWHLFKFLILGDLSPHLFGLIFLCSTSEKMGVGVHQTPPQ